MQSSCSTCIPLRAARDAGGSQTGVRGRAASCAVYSQRQTALELDGNNMMAAEALQNLQRYSNLSNLRVGRRAKASGSRGAGCCRRIAGSWCCWCCSGWLGSVGDCSFLPRRLLSYGACFACIRGVGVVGVATMLVVVVVAAAVTLRRFPVACVVLGCMLVSVMGICLPIREETGG